MRKILLLLVLALAVAFVAATMPTTVTTTVTTPVNTVQAPVTPKPPTVVNETNQSNLKKAITSKLDTANLNKRICITSEKCNCKSFANTKCTGLDGEAKTICTTRQIAECTQNCKSTSRCYAMSCQEAGYASCDKSVILACADSTGDTVKNAACIAKKTAECRRYELGTCLKARRLYRFRIECDADASKTCGSFNGVDKCQCVTKSRSDCVVEKEKKREKYVREHEKCENISKLLCDDKFCHEGDDCRKKEVTDCFKKEVCLDKVKALCKGSITGPCYDTETKACNEKWTDCEQKALETCEYDVPCARKEILKCNVPLCILDRTYCDDNDQCTDDVCDTKLGCLHTPRNCDDKNLCTTDSCDKVQGCRNVAIDCNDNVPCTIDTCDAKTGKCLNTVNKCDDNVDCTVDTCDAKTGKCSNVFTTSDKCTKACAVNADCAQWGIDKNLKDQCQQAVCDKNLGSCKTAPVTGDCVVVPDCKVSCKPRNACESAACVLDASSKLICQYIPKSCNDNDACTSDVCDPTAGCQHIAKKCDDGIACTADSCDAKTGNCVYTAQHAKCVSTEKCTAGVCTDKGCVFTPDPKCRNIKDECDAQCKPANGCEEVKCDVDKALKITCVRTPKNCNDNKPCTVDSCDVKTGQCVNTFTASATCTVPCTKNDDCSRWSAESKLGEKCQVGVCDEKAGTCHAVATDNTCITKDDCAKTCGVATVCEKVACLRDSANKITCKRDVTNCDDKKSCTIDSCDAKTGTCSNTFLKTDVCVKQCSIDSDCASWGVESKLADKCQVAVCDANLGSCKSIATTDKSCLPVITKEICDAQCKPADACEQVGCAYEAGKIVCNRVRNTCDDKVDCTVDTCDTKTGKCVNTFKKTDICVQPCAKHLDCAEWGTSQKLAEQCQVAACDAKLGSCTVVATDDKTCVPHVPTELCTQVCKPADACEKVTCAFDNAHKVVCNRVRNTCDDNVDCTVDSCDAASGKCINTFKASDKCFQQCKVGFDCNEWGTSQKLGDKCQKAICDQKLGSCIAVYSDDKDCVPPELIQKCELGCQPTNACESARCFVDTNKQPICKRKPTDCDDQKSCTVDSCDVKTGKCVNTFTVSATCAAPCVKNVDCIVWGSTQKLADKCQEATCDVKSGSCIAVAVADKKCIPTDLLCEVGCKPANKCETTACSTTNGKFLCSRNKKTCDDQKSCTVDSCDIKTGNCVNTFKQSETCLSPCDKDLDCAAWGTAQSLSAACKVAVCDVNSGSCKAVYDSVSERCKSKDECSVNTDCAQVGKCAPICIPVGGVRKCVAHKCCDNTDCLAKTTNSDLWGYCLAGETGQKDCVLKPKCVKNEDCDDKNPCTQDVCVKDYGFCRNVRRCVDNDACTADICVPSSDLRSYECRNPVLSCTNDQTLISKSLNTLSEADKSKWLGQCSHLEGCISCVVNAQCDDDNGCTADSCEEQKCLHRPINNEWCDPKIDGQPITFQSLPELRNKIILASYDTSKLQ